MNFNDVAAAIEGIAPLSGAASWDKSGLQVASPRREVAKLAVALDPTPSTIKKALAAGAEMVLTHHPLSLSPSLPNRLDNYYEALSLLMKADVPLYSSHTSLDVQPDGPAGWLARHLCLVHPDFLEETGEGAGFGLVGDLPKALSLEEITAKLAERIDLECAVLVNTAPAEIKRVAYCTGSGSSLMDEAWTKGADLYITGDVKYHAALDCRGCLLDVGHHSLEEEMMHEMQKLLAKRLEGVDTVFIPSASPFRSLKACHA